MYKLQNNNPQGTKIEKSCKINYNHSWNVQIKLARAAELGYLSKFV